jgi:hypothetical protein
LLTAVLKALFSLFPTNLTLSIEANLTLEEQALA